MNDNKTKDFYAVVSAIVKFIEASDSGTDIPVPEDERDDLIENRE